MEEYTTTSSKAGKPEAAKRSAGQQDTRSEAEKKRVMHMVDHCSPEQWEDLITKAESRGNEGLANKVGSTLKLISSGSVLS